MSLLLLFTLGVFFLLLTYTFWFTFGQDTQVNVTKDVDMIEIDVAGMSTTIIPASRNTLSAELKGKGHVTVKKYGDRIKVQYKSKNWFNGFSLFNNKKLTIYIPENYNRNLAIDSGSGTLSFSGKSKNKPMQLEDLSLHMSSGHVRLSHISTDHFEQNGSSGYVEINSLATKKGSFKMNSGKLDVKGYSGDVKATLSSGNLKLQMEKLSDSVDINVNSGFVTLDLPADADFSLNGKIGSGDISTNFSLIDLKEEKHKIEGVHGSGEYDIDLEVTSGKIELK